MFGIIRTKKDMRIRPIVAIINEYGSRRINQLNKFRKYNLLPADMPMLIHAITNDEKVHRAIVLKETDTSIDTMTAEFYGLREGSPSFETWHSILSLDTDRLLEETESVYGPHKIVSCTDDEWTSIGIGSYKGKNVPRIHLEDARKGNVPRAGTPYTIFASPENDRPIIDKGELDYDHFMRDDRILMIMGSPENREAFAKIFFGKEKKVGWGHKTIGNNYEKKELGYKNKAKGFLISLGRYHSVLEYSGGTNHIWNFAGLSSELVTESLELKLEKIGTALDHSDAFKYNGRVYAPVKGVTLGE